MRWCGRQKSLSEGIGGAVGEECVCRQKEDWRSVLCIDRERVWKDSVCREGAVEGKSACEWRGGGGEE